MLQTAGKFFSQRLQRWMPEPFVFAILLTVLVALLSIAFTDSGLGGTLDGWYRGFWVLLEFSMQMVLMLVCGYAIALTPVVSRVIDRVALWIRSPGKVYLVVVIVGALLTLISWGWVVITAVLARELAIRVKGVDYPFLIACVYISSQPWVAGLSSSIPLLLNTEGNFLISMGAMQSTLPVSHTLGGLLNLLYLVAFFIGVPLIMWLMKPAAGQEQSLQDLLVSDHRTESVREEAECLKAGGKNLSDTLNNGPVLQMLVALAALIVVIRHFGVKGAGLDLNIMIFIFLSAGLALHITPMRFVIAMKRACGNISGIVFQYPFYAGIMGMMTYSGLGGMFSEWMAANATEQTLPLLAQLCGAVVNFAIPSAGGEWAVIGPAFVEAAAAVASGMPAEQTQALIGRIAMSVAYGESSTNLLQPFFILTILPVMGAGVRIQARDVMGYLLIPFIYLTVAIALLVSLTPLN
ncbi:short-chain fatty acid transporter [Pseudomaricurvus alkylphenolicus]|jgi:short-chain fatty acids transporter|uniref:short-chain fatty acid transporter n=1 Tax=Pseudomaricurvus alkylphenolicus TaxID=1306991 RepID=UPI00141EEB7B|nr:TIGR00366 family protein [Pseudomaricurvus alkylphenolicus]NIB43662.1 short-chain fatty acid transporter [Pseudomaricurvus alkylphenolicus]